MRTAGRILLTPFRFIWHVFVLAVLGETPESRKSHEQLVAEREARKRVERHGT